MLNLLIVGIVALVLVASLVWSDSMDYKEEVAKNKLYCDMVTTYQETKGDYGWPDYNNNYNEVCK